MHITSRDNPLLRHARSVRDGKVEESIFVEGLRLCEEALSSGMQIEAVIYSEQIVHKERAAQLIAKLNKISGKSASVSETLLASISYTKTPQGIVVLAARPVHDERSFAAKQPAAPLLVLLHEVNNPVNVGAILRTAEGAGATGVIATKNTADPFSPKALRGAMGSAFRLPVWHSPNYKETVAWCKAQNILMFCADAHAEKLYTEIDWRGARALIVGPESRGLSAEDASAADGSVRIPMQGQVESLNVGSATAIILYEAANQRANAK